jgi:hypothetical protein
VNLAVAGHRNDAMSEESQGQTPAPGDVPRALPARTGGRLPALRGDWIARVLDIVEMMADATRDALLGGRKR